jgi:hypothetical protein
MIENALKMSNQTTGGEIVELPYIRVVFQQGFPRDVGVNGVRVQDVIRVALERLEFYQNGPLACAENEQAITALQSACNVLDARARRRAEQGVLNTMQPHEYARTEDECDDFSATGS